MWTETLGKDGCGRDTTSVTIGADAQSTRLDLGEVMSRISLRRLIALAAVYTLAISCLSVSVPQLVTINRTLGCCSGHQAI